MRYFSTYGINSKNSNTALTHYHQRGRLPPVFQYQSFRPPRISRVQTARIAPSAWRRGYTASSSVDRGVGYRS